MDLSELIEKSRYDNVKLFRPLRLPIVGSLVLTSFHTIFSQPAGAGTDTEDIWVVLHKSVDYTYCSRSQNGGCSVCVKCKNFATIFLLFNKYEDGQALANVINLLSNIDNYQLLYPFFYRPSYNITEDGWLAFTPQGEYSKLRIYADHWRLSSVNTDFQVCPTYPELVIVPKAVDDDVLIASSRFRDGCRFPVLSYFHPITKSALIRCSQPLVGPSNRRCKQDELLLNSMLVSSSRGYIVDTRCLAAAQSARSKGGGCEQEVFYPRWKRIHRAVPRRQAVQDCNSAGSSNNDRWLNRLGSTGWLQNVIELLDCACMIAQCIDREGEKSEVSVVVHGDEGTDTSLQVVCLVQVLLDPDCRTIRGYDYLYCTKYSKRYHYCCLSNELIVSSWKVSN
ncbi:unnamed protein product [Soboliphyme baturini]|uniref:Myotubularin phosphatase domain-containing protein n=1 Tax=Soboliphyme baturini TaxID=241478 RepID=A0A183IP66_9BILA|nr:unnamed protein product [Soboliphyme baturini]